MRIDMIGARSLPARHGGLEVAAEQLSVELVSRGHDVRALIDRVEGPRDHAGVRVEGVRSVRTKHLHAITQTVASLPPVLRARPDIAHFHGVGPGMLATVPRLRRVKSVVTVQGLDWERDKWNGAAKTVFGAGVGASLRHADEVIAVSRAIQRSIKERFDIEAHYIP
ncbi:MAG: glycosyltransferase family 4 protein, partial [Mycobacteriales bacterium]